MLVAASRVKRSPSPPRAPHSRPRPPERAWWGGAAGSGGPMDSGLGCRRGGREARRALRAAPLEEAKRPVRPGLEGGCYKPLAEAELRRIHGAALDVLEQVGVGNPIPSCVEACTAAGATLDGQGRLRFPRALVEDTVARAARRFPVCGRDPRHDMEPWGTRVYFGTAGAAVHMVDPATRAYRES